ncbi:MAG: hypothetical protein NT062_26005, partial [Proteobacteria bacterium]|nr:hypothetical protein [Pseudomonadota bacterium]
PLRYAPSEPDVEDGDDGADRPPRNRKLVAVGAASIVVGVGVVALIFLGRANSAHYTFTCQPDRIVAEQGRGFPPWGSRTLGGAAYKPIEIPPEAECQARATDDEVELQAWYLDALQKRATTLLTAREVTKVDLAEQQLQQALLFARTPERKTKRDEIEHLLGDVSYWRASAKLRDAATALAEAAKQFDAAAAQGPQHPKDASAWANYIRKIVDDLHVGPAGAPSATFPPILPPVTGRDPAPAGVALPVEPGSGSAEQPPSVPPDAGVPSGGVLL